MFKTTVLKKKTNCCFFCLSEFPSATEQPQKAELLNTQGPIITLPLIAQKRPMKKVVESQAQ
jgi:hypothetical protein